MHTASEQYSFFRPSANTVNRSGLQVSLDSSATSLEDFFNFLSAPKNEKGLKSTGVDLQAFVQAFDASLQGGVTTPSVATPIQFLQAWLPGFIHVITAPRNIDLLVGRTTLGSWEDKQIVFSVRELTGQARAYGDYTNIPLASWNVNQIVRNIVQQEQGIEVGRLETLRAARMNLDNSAEKRTGAALQLEIVRNAVGFYGYNAGNNLTYGFLNDPNELPYTTVPIGASGSTQWADKTFLEIQSDIRLFLSTLRTQSKGAIDPQKTPITLAVATAVMDYLTATSDFGVTSVADWLQKNYPNVRVENAPELDGADGGENVAYTYADEINDTSTDDRRTFIQAVPTIFMALGVLMEPKKYTEDYANATAGTSVKRPYAITRWSGI